MERVSGSDELLYRLPKNEAFLVAYNTFIPLSSVSREQFCHTPLFVMHHHNKAGDVWDRAFALDVIPEKSRLLHINAHDDLAIHEPFPDTSQEVGSCILPRVESGIISSIIWLTRAPYKALPSERISDYPHSLISPLLTKRPTIQEIKTLTEEEPFDLLDIDLDYFTEGLPETLPNIVLRYRARKMLEDIRKKTKEVKITTVAISPGYIQSGREKVLLDEVLRTFC